MTFTAEFNFLRYWPVEIPLPGESWYCTSTEFLGVLTIVEKTTTIYMQITFEVLDC